MSKLLLINPPTPFLAFPNTAPHLGIGYLISYLQVYAKDIQVSYLNLECSDPQMIEIPEGFDFYGITSVTPQYFFANLLKTEIINRKLGKTIIGGCHASVQPEKCLRDGFDFIVQGYGEVALLNILRGGHKPGIIQGQFIDDLNSLPFPAWDEMLKNRHDVSYGNRVAHIFSVRGCPYNCAYCSAPLVYSTKVGYRSIKNVVDEIVFLKESFNIDSIYFIDATFTLNKKRTIKLSKRLSDLDLNWACQTRVDLVDEEIFKSLKQGGCNQISFGIETGSSTVHEILGKKTTINQNKIAIKMARDNGLKTKAFLMGALPNENWETSKKFKEFILEIKPDNWIYSTFTPFPGTVYWNYPKKFGISILCKDFRTYYPLGLNAKGPINISNKYLSRDELKDLRDDMLSFLRKELPNPRVEEAIKRFPQQQQKIIPFFQDLELKYVY